MPDKGQIDKPALAQLPGFIVPDDDEAREPSRAPTCNLTSLQQRGFGNSRPLRVETFARSASSSRPHHHQKLFCCFDLLSLARSLARSIRKAVFVFLLVCISDLALPRASYHHHRRRICLVFSDLRSATWLCLALFTTTTAESLWV